MNCSDIISPATMTPAQAMALPDKDKLAYFWQVRVKHPRVRTVLDDLETMVLPASGTDIALLIGPTGVGKTTLAESLKEMIITLHQDEVEKDLSFIPAVLITAPSSGEKSFSWRMFYISLGQALNEPLLEKKQEINMADGRMTIRPITAGSTVAGLRMSIENALRHRKTLLVIIDEAVHLIRHAKGDALAAHMDALKSLTTMKGITLTLALVGSYDLYQLMSLSGQIARRTAIVHFARYCSGIADDVTAFKNSLKKMQKYMPLKGVPDLTLISNELMWPCIGCVGILKETLQRALTFALRNKGKWSDQCLKKALLSETQVDKILQETLQGEANIEKAIYGSGTLASEAKEETKAA